MLISALNVTAVKGLRLQNRAQLELEAGGVREDRRFHLIDERGRMINAKHVGALQTVIADYSDSERQLTLTFANGTVISAPAIPAAKLQTQFYSRPRAARLIPGPWDAALSELAGRRLRLVQTTTGGVDRGVAGAVSLISRATVQRLAEVAGREEVDSRRFRMLIEIDGAAAHEEDGWIGHRVRLGGAVVRFTGHVGRCAVTTRDPDTGEVTLPTLDLLGRYRGDAQTTEPLALGIYGEVRQPGLVRVDDGVTVL
jgi:hypothetical protein